MNEIAQELLKRADVIGAWLSGAVTKTADFATAQAIDIAMQYVAFGRAWYTTATVLSILGVGLSCWIGKKSIKNLKEDDVSGLFYMVPLFVIAPTSVIVFFNALKDCIMVWAAPKVWLMIQLAELAKQVK